MQFPKNLSQLKKYFSAGGSVTLVEHIYINDDGKEFNNTSNHRYANLTRKPSKVQTNCVYLDDSRLDYGKATNWTFDPILKQAVFDGGWVRMTYVLNDAA